MTLLNSKKEYQWDVFISYSRKDETRAVEIQEAIKKSGLHVWRDKDQIMAGDLFVKKIEEALEQTYAVIILISKNSMESNWVEEEYCRAISISNSLQNPLRIIPVLIGGVTSPPGFLASRSWVDLSDGAKFTQNIGSLINGIKSGLIPTQSHPKRSSLEKKHLKQLRFILFFPEGINKFIYDHLISKLKAQKASDWAFKEGIIENKIIYGVQMKTSNLISIGEFQSYIQDSEEELKFKDDLLAVLDNYVEDTGIFTNRIELGKGCALLLRDLISLTEHSGETKKNTEVRKRICTLARENISQIIQEGYYRIGWEIRNALSNVAYARSSIDDLTDAQLNLRIGKALKAADIFDAWRGDNLFADLGLNYLDRISFALDWAKASKDAGRAREYHDEIINSYNQILNILDKLISSAGGDNSNLRRLKAEVLNNRGTQMAYYGAKHEWPEVQKDINQAAEIFVSFRQVCVWLKKIFF
jgi:hypothetical protein